MLEVGGGSGDAGADIRELVGAGWYAEVGPAPARPRAHVDRVHPWPPGAAVPVPAGGPFDLLVALDSLSLLSDPWDALAALVGALRPGGHALVSLPNARSIRRLAALAGGGAGAAELPDAAGVRHFTLADGHALLAGAGLRVDECRALIEAPVPELRDAGNALTCGRCTVADLSREEAVHLLASGYLFLARRPPEPDG